MTYISAWRSQANSPEHRGVVMVADTQETWVDATMYAEKLSIHRTETHELCIGGAGRSELIKGFIQLVAERVGKEKPKDDAALEATLRGALSYFYRNDVAFFPAGKDEDRDVQFLIAARSSRGDISLWKTEAMRLFPVEDYAVTGHETPFCEYMLRKVYDASIPLDNAVLTSAWIVSIAKDTSTYVGGKTSIVTIGSSGIYRKTAKELEVIESTVAGHEEAISLTMAVVSDSMAKHLGSSAPFLSLEINAGKIKQAYPAPKPLPPGYVNQSEFERCRNLAAINAFVSSASGSIRGGKIVPSATTKALLNETISELNIANAKVLEWHDAAVRAQSDDTVLPNSEALEQAANQAATTFRIYLAYVLKELAAEVMRSTPQTSPDRPSPCDEGCPETDQNGPGD